jgi:hypothetical protein
MSSRWAKPFASFVHFMIHNLLFLYVPQMCGRCKKRQRCTKGFSIQKFPKVLIIRILYFESCLPTETLHYVMKFSLTVCSQTSNASTKSRCIAQSSPRLSTSPWPHLTCPSLLLTTVSSVYRPSSLYAILWCRWCSCALQPVCGIKSLRHSLWGPLHSVH